MCIRDRSNVLIYAKWQTLKVIYVYLWKVEKRMTENASRAPFKIITPKCVTVMQGASPRHIRCLVFHTVLLCAQVLSVSLWNDYVSECTYWSREIFSMKFLRKNRLMSAKCSSHLRPCVKYLAGLSYTYVLSYWCQFCQIRHIPTKPKWKIEWLTFCFCSFHTCFFSTSNKLMRYLSN